MNKIKLSTLILGAVLLTTIGATSAMANKTTKTIMKPIMKCGAGKMAKIKPVMKCGAGKCGASKMTKSKMK